MHEFITSFTKYFVKGKEKGPSLEHPQSTTPPHNFPDAVHPSSKSADMGPTTSGVLSRIVPLAAFSLAFAIVMTVLVIYMENTAMRHYQFRMNMSQDYELPSLVQDNPQLVSYIREVHLRPAVEPHHKPLESNEVGPAEDVAYVLKLLNNKKRGVFVEAGAYNDGNSSKTEWLERKLGWRGLLVQSDARHYFILRRHNRIQSQAVHACLSTMPYPKEVTFHHQEGEVKVNSISNNNIKEDPEWFTTRIKCFPIFSLLLAINTTNIDFLSLEASGSELEVLETVPFDRVKIEVIEVVLAVSELQRDAIKSFLSTKQYTFMESFDNSYIFMINKVKI